MRSVEQNLQETDRVSLALVEVLKSRFQETTTVVGPVGNLYTVFFHDLMLHFSGILIHRIAREHYRDPVQFPRVNKHYALSPYSVSSQDLVPSPSGRRLKTLVRRLPLSRVALGEALPFGYGQGQVTSKIINLLGSFKPFVRAHLPKQREQIDSLLDTVDEVCRLYEIPRRGIVRENWCRYAKFHTTEIQAPLRERGIILGTRNNLQNRKLAVNYLQQDKEVVAITHGEVSNSVMDEPPFGYSERTLCTTLIDYGDFDEDGDYNRALLNPVQRFYRSAPTVAGQYRSSSRIRRPDPSRCRTLYIPTTYSGNDLYGPFHIYEDAVYRQWQSILFEVLPRLTMKTHPQSKYEPSVPGALIERRQLEECIADYDLLVFDYFATGAVLAVMSNKPVIYFDIGLRRLAPKFATDLRDRCEYAKISLSSDMRKQCADAMEKFWSADREWSNSEIFQYSMCEEEHFHWPSLFKAVSTGLPPSW